MADLEQERVTALWREAADALERTEREQRVEFVLAADAIAHLREERDEFQAECGRLREQLDAARQALDGAVVERSAADALADACDAAVRSGYIGSRSEIADALLGYRDVLAATRAANPEPGGTVLLLGL